MPLRYLSPLESGADLMVVLGGVGLLSGLGGKYLFVIPVLKNTNWGEGGPLFSTNIPGVFAGPNQTGSMQGNLFTSTGLTTAIAYQFGLEFQTLGLNTNSYSAHNGGIPTSTIWSAQGVNTPGPLGQHSGFIFLALLGVGLVLRGGLPYV